MIDAEVAKAIGENIPSVHEPIYDASYAIYVLHGDKAGKFMGIQMDRSFEESYVIEKEIRVSVGSTIEAFNGANQAIGTLFLKFNDNKEMHQLLPSISDTIKIIVD